MPLLRSLNEYSVAARSFSSNERQIVEIFGLSLLEDPLNWGPLLAIKEGRTQEQYQVYQNINFSITYLPKLVNLFMPLYFSLKDLPPEELSKEKGYEKKAFLSVLLAESNNMELTSERVTNFLSSINLLYESCATIQKETSALILIGFDSGSDKAFDFIGAAKVIQMIKEIIIALWDRIVFFREKKFEQRLDLVAKSLPIIEEIHRLEKSKKIGKEQAEILRNNIYKSVTGFINSGAYTPEMQKISEFNPRELMAPSPKLLSEGSGDTSEKK